MVYHVKKLFVVTIYLLLLNVNDPVRFTQVTENLHVYSSMILNLFIVIQKTNEVIKYAMESHIYVTFIQRNVAA